jgi:hypothetical protein
MLKYLCGNEDIPHTISTKMRKHPNSSLAVNFLFAVKSKFEFRLLSFIILFAYFDLGEFGRT